MESCKSFQVPSLEPVVLTDHLLAVLARAFGIIYPTSWTTQTQGKQKEQNTSSTYYLCTEFSNAMGLAMGHNTKKTYGIHSIHAKNICSFSCVSLYSNMVSSIYSARNIRIRGEAIPIGLRKRVLQGSRSCSPMSFLETPHTTNAMVV